MSCIPAYIVYTYVQPRYKKVNMTTYVHTGGVSNTHNDVLMFIGSQMVGSE